MTKKEFQNQKKRIRALYEEGETNLAESCALQLIQRLHKDKNYEFIVELYKSRFIESKDSLWTFEVAYALAEVGDQSEAEVIYDYIVALEPENAAALNNLSNIKKGKGNIDEAFELIERAYKIEPEDEIISRNYENLLATIQEREEVKLKYQNALTYIPKENEFVLQKLLAFFSTAKKDRVLRNNRMPIPKWKFKVMMGTDDQKAQSLLDQWLEKGYLRRTGERGLYQEHIYELNPFLFKELTRLKPKKLNPQWMQGIEQLGADTLDRLSYFTTIQRVERVKKIIRAILLRDVDELFLNYVMKNHKAVVILSGSIVEILLIYYCEKKHMKEISYQSHNKVIKKKLYECDLGDLLSYFEQSKILGDVVVHLGNISRIYRNFVHPGKELRERAVLDQAKADLCFGSTLEILNRVFT